MKTEIIERAIKLTALVQVVLEEMDFLSQNGAVFKNSLKYKGKAFVVELERFTNSLYQGMKCYDNHEEAEKLYYKNVKVIEELMKAYFNGDIVVQEDHMKDWIPIQETQYTVAETGEIRQAVIIEGKKYMPKIHAQPDKLN